MNDKEDVLQYYQHFLVLSKPLLDSQQLTIREHDKAFWCGFHSRDHTEMYSRLIAKHPDQPAGIHFNYLDVYRMARATFSGNHLLDLEPGDPWDDSGLRGNCSGCMCERWLDQDEHNSCRPEAGFRMSAPSISPHLHIPQHFLSTCRHSAPTT